MAAENSTEANDEKEILIKKDAIQEIKDLSGAVTECPKLQQSKLTLYHWTQSFSSQKVRLAVAEKGLRCEEYDVSLPLSEHNEPWFMHLNPAGEVPVLAHNDSVICDPVQIMDYLEQNFRDEGTPKLIPEEGSMYYHRVQHYRELLDSLQMDAYTHGCILHPEITVDSHIPAYATTRIRTQIGNTESELKKLAEENPDLKDAYIAKQRRLKHKLFDHDNMKYLKKLLDELENVMDQLETELQRRVEETPEEGRQAWLCGDFFSMADVSLAVTLHRLKFLGLSRRYWGNGKRVNVEGLRSRQQHPDLSGPAGGVPLGQEERAGSDWLHAGDRDPGRSRLPGVPLHEEEADAQLSVPLHEEEADAQLRAESTGSHVPQMGWGSTLCEREKQI